MPTVKVHVSSPDTFSERQYDLHLTIGQLKVWDGSNQAWVLGRAHGRFRVGQVRTGDRHFSRLAGVVTT